MGTWEPGTTYVKGSLVVFNGSIWESLSVNTHSEPSNINANWLLVVDGSGNPFDQSLNTTDSPTFEGVTVGTLTLPTPPIVIAVDDVLDDGSLPAGEYYIKIVGVGLDGTFTPASNEIHATIDVADDGSGDVAISGGVPLNYRIYYGSTPGGQDHYIAGPDIGTYPGNVVYFFDLSSAVAGSIPEPSVPTVAAGSLSVFSDAYGQAVLLGGSGQDPWADRVQMSTILIGDRETIEAWSNAGEFQFWFGFSPTVEVSSTTFPTAGNWYGYAHGAVMGNPGVTGLEWITLGTNFANGGSTSAPSGIGGYIGTFNNAFSGMLANNKVMFYLDQPNAKMQLNTTIDLFVPAQKCPSGQTAPLFIDDTGKIVRGSCS